ncbi:MAG: hypothetical protein F4Z28_10655 [Gammaproteobacteria bacterium]|nr:hypothetical protein [Gammaproteobacteria bacterium]
MNEIEGTYSDDLAKRFPAGRVRDFRGKPNDLSRLRHLLEHHQLQAAKILQTRQLFRLRHRPGHVDTVRVLRGHQGSEHFANGVARHVTHYPEQFAEVADSDSQSLRKVGKIRFVLLVAPVQVRAATLFRLQLPGHGFEHTLPFVPGLAETFHSGPIQTRTLLGLDADEFQQLQHRVGLTGGYRRLGILLGGGHGGKQERSGSESFAGGHSDSCGAAMGSARMSGGARPRAMRIPSVTGRR